MAIDLITGQPRNGKSQYALKLIFDDIKANDKLEKEGKERRPIFADIAGINAPQTPTQLPDVQFIPMDKKIWFGDYITAPEEVPEGYWCPPPNSIFYFDESHKLDWVKDSSGTVSKNPTTISLNEHGHIGHDIKLITQFANYIHTHIRGLIQLHMHVKRVHGAAFAWVYKWDEFQLNPRTKVALDNCFEKDKFFFKKKYQDAYQSASAHSKIKFKIPAKLIPFLIIIPLMLFALWYVGRDSMFAKKLSDEQQAQVEAEQLAQTEQVEEVPPPQDEIEQLTEEQLRHKYLPKHIAVMANSEEVRPAMVISNSNGDCVAYNKYGEVLLISDSLCYQMQHNSGMMPKPRKRTPAYQAQAQNQEAITKNPFSQGADGQLDIDYVDNSGFITGSN